MKRLICIILASVMMLALVPSVAFAATSVTAVKVTGVQTPAVGQPCSVDGIKVETEPANAYVTEGEKAAYIYWWDETDNDYTSPTDTFIEGHKYHLSVELYPADGYVFPYKDGYTYLGTATVNGKAAKDARQSSSKDGKLFMTGDLDILPVEGIPITSVTVTGVPTPVVGQPCSVDGIKVETVPANAAVLKYAIWWDYTYDNGALNTDTFVADHEYALDVMIDPKEGYCFPFDFGDVYTGSATVNGADAARKELWYASTADGLFLEDAARKPDTVVPITSVIVTGVPTPVVGQPCSVDGIKVVTDPENAYVTEGEKAAYIYWYDQTDGDYTSPTDTFIEGHKYHLSVELYPKGGYEFPYAENGTTFTGNATVNGGSAEEALRDSGSGMLFIAGEWSIVPVTGSVVTSVSVTGVQTPVVGQPCSVEGIKVVTDPANAFITEGEGALNIYWFDETADGHHYPDEDDVFIEDHTYHLSVELYPKEGFSIIFDCGDYVGHATFNGLDAARQEYVFGSENGLFLASQSMSASSLSVVTSVTITGVQTPVIGKPCSVEGIKIETDPENAYVTEGENAPDIFWYDETDSSYLSASDTFIEGHEYSIAFAIVPANGYVFTFDSDTVYTGTATVNGETAVIAGISFRGGGTGLYVKGNTYLPVEAPAFTYGDVNSDGKVNAKDASALAKSLAGWTITIDEAAADVNCDGKVNGKDLSLMLKFFAGWDVKLGA